MSTSRRTTEYQELVRRCRPRAVAPKSREEQLDALLTADQRDKDGEAAPEVDERAVALDALRQQMREQLLPVFEALKAKYQESGIIMAIDAEDFLSGGVKLTIEVRYDIYGMRLDGTATPAGIAFHENRFSKDVLGVVTTGPMLRARNLSGQVFREFVCDRVGQIVRSALRRRQVPSG